MSSYNFSWRLYQLRCPVWFLQGYIKTEIIGLLKTTHFQLYLASINKGSPMAISRNWYLTCKLRIPGVNWPKQKSLICANRFRKTRPISCTNCAHVALFFIKQYEISFCQLRSVASFEIFQPLSTTKFICLPYFGRIICHLYSKAGLPSLGKNTPHP